MTSNAPVRAYISRWIVQKHCFGDGNRRTGFLLTAVFLEVNGWRLNASEESVVAHTSGLAAGRRHEDAYAQWLRDNSQRSAT